MNGVRDHRAIARLLTASALLAAGALLSGCIAASIPDKSVARPTPIETSSAPATPTPTSSPTSTPKPSATLTFADGARLPKSTYIEWGDGLAFDKGWSVNSPDDGNGNWSYINTDRSCTASFWQGRIIDSASADDRAASDVVLATFLKADVSQLAGKAGNSTFPYMTPGNTGADMRQLRGKESWGTWVLGARAFLATQTAMYIIVDCKNENAETVAKEVFTKSAIVAH